MWGTAMTKPLLVLQLIHGRHHPDAATDGWGFDAKPIVGVVYFHSTYLETLTVGFDCEDSFEQAKNYTGWKSWDDLILEIPNVNKLIHCGDAYYGDFEIYQSKLLDNVCEVDSS